jgi:hypothetical protein
VHECAYNYEGPHCCGNNVFGTSGSIGAWLRYFFRIRSAAKSVSEGILTTLGPGPLIDPDQTEYLGQVVFVLATFVSKFRYFFVLRKIGPSQQKEPILKICFVLTLLGAISFVAVTIFQCSHPVWNLHSQRCIHQV